MDTIITLKAVNLPHRHHRMYTFKNPELPGHPQPAVLTMGNTHTDTHGSHTRWNLGVLERRR